MVWAVSLGSFQYPFISVGPLTTISPCCPEGSSWPSLSKILMVLHFNRLLPIEPYLGGRLAGCPEVVAPDSVNPQPSLISTPIFCFHLRAASTGSAAPPELQSSSELKSYLSRPGKSSIWIYMVGTAAMWVTRNAWMFLSASSTFHHLSTMAFPPTK